MKNACLAPIVVPDKLGRDITYKIVRDEIRPELLEFYLDFEPKGQAQGLPPYNNRLIPWVDGIICDWVSFGAFYNNNLVAHAAVECAPTNHASEYFIFVDPRFQNVGIGTEISKYLIAVSQITPCKALWLTVQTSNSRAIRVYQKVGFVFDSPISEEREMILTLKDKNK